MTIKENIWGYLWPVVQVFNLLSVTTLVLSPIFGILSDRCRLKIGKRRPFMIGGSIILMSSLMCQTLIVPNVFNFQNPENHTCSSDKLAKRCLPYIKHIPREKTKNHQFDTKPIFWKYKIHLFLFLFLNICACASQSAFSVAYHGMLADRVSSDSRGFVSGMMGSMALVGNLVGATSGILLNFMSLHYVYTALCSINLIFLIIVMVICKENNEKTIIIVINTSFMTVVNSFWRPLKNYNFRWVFVTRFLMQQGVSTVTAFLEYWIDDMVIIPNCWSPEAGLTFVLIPMLLTSAIFSIIIGYISDKLKRRKCLIIYSCLIMSSCALLVAFSPDKNRFYYGIISSLLFGVGYGSYTSVDFALIMDVTENSSDKATDLAVWHQAMILPSCIATPIGGIIVDGFQRINCEIGLGYILVYCVASAYFILGGIFVLKLKNIA